jgi:hypothetical protein
LLLSGLSWGNPVGAQGPSIKAQRQARRQTNEDKEAQWKLTLQK